MKKVKTLIRMVKTELPQLDDLMHKGAGSSQIERLEATLEQTLPDSYKALLRCYNGEKDVLCFALGFAFLSISEILQEWQYFSEQESTAETGELYQENRVLPALYHRGRVPFAHDGSGNYLCFDFAPDSEGAPGQIIYLPCGEPDPISVIFRDFDHCLDFWMTALQRGRLALIDDDPDFYYEFDWRDDWTDIADEQLSNP